MTEVVSHPRTLQPVSPAMDAFPSAVPEIPVADLDVAGAYYENQLGFAIDWGGASGGIAGISQGSCRLFLTDARFRKQYGNAPAVLVWLNLESKRAVDELHETWS